MAVMLFLTLCVSVHISTVNAMDPADMPVMNPNSGIDKIWGRWEPMVKTRAGCNGYPMVTHDGIVADSWQKYDRRCEQRDPAQAYARSWIAASGEMGLVYGYWSPKLMYCDYNLVYFVIWMRGRYDETPYGCSAYGWSLFQKKMRWIYYPWNDGPWGCKRQAVYDSPNANGGFRLRLYFDETDLSIGDREGTSGHDSNLLMWLYMGEAAINALSKTDFGHPGESVIFREDQWNDRMNAAFRDEAYFASLETSDGGP